MTPPSQLSILWKIPTPNMLLYMQDYKAIPHFSDDELKKNSCLIFR